MSSLQQLILPAHRHLISRSRYNTITRSCSEQVSLNVFCQDCSQLKARKSCTWTGELRSLARSISSCSEQLRLALALAFKSMQLTHISLQQ